MVLYQKNIEDCLADIPVTEFGFERPVSENFIRHMAKLGRLEYFAHFPRPYYRITSPRQFILKGVLNQTSCHVTFINYSESLERSIFSHLHGYKDKQDEK